MEPEITTEELGQIIRAARVLSPDFDEEQLQSLACARQKLADSGFLEAVWGMVRLQEEQGISCSEALAANQDLLKQKTGLESELAILKEKVPQEQNRYIEAKKVHQQVVSEISSANNELQAIQSDIQTEREQLSSFQKKAEKEKRQIEKELEQCKKNAGVTAEDIVAAGQLKAEVEKSGFSLETMLGLVQEFAPYQDAKERLAGALKTSHSLTEYISTLEGKSEEKKRAISAAIDQLLKLKTAEESEVNRLKEGRRLLEVSVSRLQADLDQEQGLRQFYVRYSPASDLMEYLASWQQVFFLRCDNSMCDPFAGITRFWTDRPVRKCPHCGMGLIKPDSEPFRLLQIPEGTTFALKLG